MDYQITCVCGHRFLVSQEKVGGPVICPNCRQRLSPVIETPGTGGQSAASPEGGTAPSATPLSPVSASADETKRCPFCGEVILAIARKCKHCGEFLDRAAPPSFAQGAAAQTMVPSGPVPPTDVPPVYAVSISQWDNFWKFVILLIVSAAVIAGLWLIPPLQLYKEIATPGVVVFAGFFGWFFYLAARNTRVYVRPTRIDTEEGILSKELNSLEMFRITDLELKQGLVERILGIGTIKIMTTESGGGAEAGGHGEPELILYQIPRLREVYKYIQNQIPIAAKQRGAVYMET